jgi:hypothetical protein
MARIWHCKRREPPPSPPRNTETRPSLPENDPPSEASNTTSLPPVERTENALSNTGVPRRSNISTRAYQRRNGNTRPSQTGKTGTPDNTDMSGNRGHHPRLFTRPNTRPSQTGKTGTPGNTDMSGNRGHHPRLFTRPNTRPSHQSRTGKVGTPGNTGQTSLITPPSSNPENSIRYSPSSSRTVSSSYLDEIFDDLPGNTVPARFEANEQRRAAMYLGDVQADDRYRDSMLGAQALCNTSMAQNLGDTPAALRRKYDLLVEENQRLQSELRQFREGFLRLLSYPTSKSWAFENSITD